VTAWLEGTALATWVRESPSLLAYPLILTIHTLGLGIVVGATAVVAFRLLGFARTIALPSLSPLFQLIWWAFAMNAATGVLLFMADATKKASQPVFYIKLTFIGLALCTVVMAKRAAIQNRQSSPVAVTSLLLWTGAITAGRLMAYL
jgi:hypothetical protein